MKKILTYIIPIALLLQACSSTSEPIDEEAASTISATSLAENSTIKTGKATLQSITSQINSNGKIHIPPSDLISIHSKTEGYITEINYLPGEYAKKGSTLIRIENPKLIEMQRIFLETKAELDLAEKEYARKSALRNDNATSERLYDDALSRRDRLKASYSGYRAQLQTIGIGISNLESTASYQLSISIRAQKSGYVSDVMVNKGQFVTAETPLMQLASDEHLHIELKVFDCDAPKVKIGQIIQFTTSNSAEEYDGKVVHINPVLDDKDGSLMVHCHFEKNPNLKAGMYISAQINMGENKTLCLPASAAVKEGNEYFAYQIIGSEVVKIALTNVLKSKDWVSSKEIQVADAKWVTEGAYYVE